jgi:hypothetical protein
LPSGDLGEPWRYYSEEGKRYANYRDVRDDLDVPGLTGCQAFRNEQLYDGPPLVRSRRWLNVAIGRMRTFASARLRLVAEHASTCRMSKQKMILIGMLPLVGCASVATPPNRPNAKIGQAALIDGVVVRPIRVVEDSRCPSDVRCIWEGRLRIEAVIQFRGASEELRREMTLGKAVSLPQGALSLSEAAPDVLAGKARAPSDYRFTFELTP